MMQVIEEKFELTINEITKIYERGMIVTITSNIEHGGRAITDCKLSDIFCPSREEYN